MEIKIIRNSGFLVRERLSVPWPAIVVTEDGWISVVYGHDELRWATGSQSPMGYGKVYLHCRALLGPVIGCVVFSQAHEEQLKQDTENVFAAKILNASSPEFIQTVRAALLMIISAPKRQSFPVSESQIYTATAQELWTICIDNFGPWGSRSYPYTGNDFEPELYYYNCMIRREQFFRTLIPVLENEFPTLTNIELKKFYSDDEPDTLTMFIRVEFSVPHPEWPGVTVYMTDEGVKIRVGDTEYYLRNPEYFPPYSGAIARGIYPTIDPEQDSFTRCISAVIARLKHISKGGAMCGDKFLDIDKLHRAGIYRCLYFYKKFYFLPPW